MTVRFFALFISLLTEFYTPCLAAEEMTQAAPSCTLSSLDKAQHYAVEQFRGQVVYVDFWASWCPPCAKSFPFLNQLHQDLNTQGLQVIAVNLDEELSDAQAFLQKHQVNFMLALDPQEHCAKAFEVMAMPSSYLIDKKGIIRHKQLGFTSDSSQQLRLLAEQLLKEPAPVQPTTF